MRHLAFAFIVFSLLFTDAGGQDGNEQADQTDELSLSIKSLNFIRNNEYYNPIKPSDFILSNTPPWRVDKSLWIEGYTLTGFFFQPELIYSPSHKIKLRAGGHFLKYSGTGKFTRIRPVFSISLKLSEITTLKLGTLSGSDSHRMFDPHFNSERLYYAYVEDGLQLMTTNDHFFNDVWLSWENFIFRGDTTREIFTFGESFRYKSPVIANFVEIEVPVQMQFKHYGGQISDYPEHVTTFFNFAAGARVNADLGGKRYGRAGVEYIHFLNSVIPERKYNLINNGHASWLKFHYNYKVFYMGASYWKANDFYAPNGNGIYGSVFVFDSDYVVHRRKIINASANINLLPESYLELLFGFEVFYDVCEKRMDHALTLHLDFEKLFRIK
jgi:hypothetical protein